MTAMSTHEIESDLCLPPRVFFLPILAMAVACGLAEIMLPRPTEAMVASLILMFLSALFIFVDHFISSLLPSYCIVVYSISVLCITYLVRNPWLLSLMSFPTLISGILLGRRGLYLTMCTLAAGLLSMFYFANGAVSIGATVVSLAAVCGTTLLLRLLWQPVWTSQAWLWSNYRRARVLLDQARDTQAELRAALSAQSQATRDLVLATERLAAMRLIAEDAQRSKSEFAANVSHEFRAPLNIIIGLSEILVDAPDSYGIELPPQVQRDIGILHRNAQHMSDMVGDVLDLSQVEAGRLSLRREWATIDELVESACSVVKPLLDDKGLYLERDLSPHLLPTFCDPARVRQILLNLISNASRFTDHGGIRISVCIEGPDTHFSVHDTGPGISPENIERIFEPFEQAIRTPSHERMGSGLGLSICKRFVEMHQGTMWVDSIVGEGSTFHFRLPTEPPARVPAPAHRWITLGWTHRKPPAFDRSLVQRKRIVLQDSLGQLAPLLARYADDVETIQIEEVADLGRVSDATSPILALINQRTPDLAMSAVLDATKIAPDLPIFGCAIPAHEQRALEAGAVAQIVKPVSQSDLRQALQGLTIDVRSVMVIDDDIETLWLMRRKLALLDRNLDIRTSSSGQKAIESLDVKPVDVILLDIVMPEHDGWQTLRVLRNRSSTMDTPVVIVSARDPAPEPVGTNVLAVGMGQSLSVHRVLRCTRAISQMLLRSGQDTDVGHREDPPATRAW